MTDKERKERKERKTRIAAHNVALEEYLARFVPKDDRLADASGPPAPGGGDKRD